ncbi:60S acidic ribosomal protein P2 [Polychytrium aggregatum]|uniref:60S acidic ribosomal protein P2 n=1 Tax=Polychytrium aggregatum TaxID=110093 RepID=UPI0022FDB334|nr:60S acidic ribosomal protein P2 [Polychytrium aggregatum]KAI9199700.1 60S acidic ribosomal protein P2 [Polychytrium aggregatum]
MKYLSAYLLATLGGNATPSVEDITNILGSVGIEVETERVEALVAELNGKDINELIAEGSAKLASVPAGGAVAASSGAAPAAAAAPAGGAAPAKAAEKAPEPEEEEDDDMGFGLFD